MTSELQLQVFERARAMLAKLTPPLEVIKDEPDDFQVTATKPAVIGKRKMDSVWFAGVKMTKSDVTLHFLPVYCDASLAKELSPIFMKTLKGKACFHLGKFDSELVSATEDALAKGMQAYRDRDWI